MKIAIGCDPNAQEAKEELITFMKQKQYGEITDFGSADPIYANTAIRVAQAVASGDYDRGIIICGTGIGVSISANKVKGAYAALLSDVPCLGNTGPTGRCGSARFDYHFWNVDGASRR